MLIKITIETYYTPSEIAERLFPGDLAKQWLSDYDLDCMVEEKTFRTVTAEEQRS